MPSYNSGYTGLQIDESVSKYFEAKAGGGIVNANALTTTLSNYLLGTTAASTYLTKTDATNTYAPKTGTGTSGTWPINISGSSASCTGNAASASSVTWGNISGRPNYLYIISKSTSSGTSISITLPGKANAGYDRNMIWAFGNMNGTPYYGVITTTSGSDGSNPTAKFTGSHAPTCTYANSGSDRIITITGLSSWGTMTLFSYTTAIQ